ncbi:SRPBCC family protein [Mesorhizobium sp. A623]
MNVPTTKAEVRPELIIHRTLTAPRALVFEVWTDGEHLKRWCCPTGFTIPFSEGDIRTGGKFRTCMRSPQGEDHWLSGAYIEIVPGEKIVFTHAWQEAAGRSGHETTVTVMLADAEGGGTRLTLHQSFFDSEASRDGHLGGWNDTLDSLDRYLAR